MTNLAYVLFHSMGLSGIIGLLINILVLALVIVLVFWVLGLVGVPDRIARIVCAILVLLCIASLFAGCAGYSYGVGLGYGKASADVRIYAPDGKQVIPLKR